MGMSYSYPEAWPEIAWAKLPVGIRKRAVERLRAAYDLQFFEEVRTLAQEQGLGNWLPVTWHFGQGTQVRNVLRSNHTLYGAPPKPRWWKRSRKPLLAPIYDSELPGLPEVYGEDYGGNWDDYYVQCVEAAAGLREIESE